MGFYGEWAPYVPVAERKQRAENLIAKRAKKGAPLSPVRLSARAIAQSFWGQAWCRNLESYSDFESRLPRGRSYVRNGSVVDLQINAGTITALVQGTSLYRVRIEISTVAPARWQELCRSCASGLGSIVELLSGRISAEVMSMVTHREKGLFPSPAEIEMSCSCPDFATMCKHVAATLYGVGARFDTAPELLFALRNVDLNELVAKAGAELSLANSETADVLTAEAGALGALFGIEIANPVVVLSGDAEPQTDEIDDSPAAGPTKTLRAKQKRSSPQKKHRVPKAYSAQREQLTALRSLLRRLQRP